MNPASKNQSPITARLFTDPACPYGYSASPALRTIEWRYRDQIEWQLVLIGLSEPGSKGMGLTQAELSSRYHVDLRQRYGMPFAIEPKIRRSTSSRACQAVVAARLIQRGSEWRTLRALQLLNFNTPLLLDDDEQLRAALSTVEGLPADRIVDSLDSHEVQDAYRTDWAEARTAADGPTHLMEKHANTPDGIRYTPPSIIFEAGLQRIEVGGFQPVEAYDVAVANLDPGLRRHGPPESPRDALALYPGGLTTQEVASIMTEGNDPIDKFAAEKQLILLLGDRQVKRIPMGNDALWIAA
jgi:predicted DsbA family dithiol-disulfide isomerase